MTSAFLLRSCVKATWIPSNYETTLALVTSHIVRNFRSAELVPQIFGLETQGNHTPAMSFPDFASDLTASLAANRDLAARDGPFYPDGSNSDSQREDEVGSFMLATIGMPTSASMTVATSYTNVL